MDITCEQMDVLISFYLEGGLSTALKSKVEEHLSKCATCRAKMEIIKSMLRDIKNSLEPSTQEYSATTLTNQYKVFKNNLSAYIDNELPSEDNIKIKKFTINNKKARQDLEDTYNIRKLMNDSFKKTTSDMKHDFSKNVMKELDLNDENNLAFHPLLKVAIAFVMTVLTLSAIIVFALTF